MRVRGAVRVYCGLHSCPNSFDQARELGLGCCRVRGGWLICLVHVVYKVKLVVVVV